jgi:hypothetical protein
MKFKCTQNYSKYFIIIFWYYYYHSIYYPMNAVPNIIFIFGVFYQV